ncbi:hypothetical protein J1605_022337 [Eschrichtius robustus]|uniref:Uncharacterized protein n=1 Tax=Eschrichtius robustus TaxID=9764 RepID=A0AB34HD48_ESCRO|nr:hypothetical protein J1605_022337 [Eschrichtius robustus]
MRAVKCVNELLSAVLDDRLCHGASRPSDRQCSSSCAGGIQRRVVVCQDENGQSAGYCDAASKPPESKHCDSGPCPRWSYGSWGEVSHTIS